MIDKENSYFLAKSFGKSDILCTFVPRKTNVLKESAL